MTSLELTRSSGDRRCYELSGIGSLRLGGLLSRGATAEAGGAPWSFTGAGVLRRSAEAMDVAGTVVGAFEARAVRRGGALRWGERSFELRSASRWRERYALVEGDRELAVLDGKGWGSRPVRITVDDPQALDPGLLLFAAFVVRGLAANAAASAG